MSESRYIEGARVLIALAQRDMADFEPSELVSLLAVALGLRIGEQMFPHDPRMALAQMGITLGVSAHYAQRQLTQDAINSCEGRA